jgi:hypothetical protein
MNSHVQLCKYMLASWASRGRLCQQATPMQLQHGSNEALYCTIQLHYNGIFPTSANFDHSKVSINGHLVELSQPCQRLPVAVLLQAQAVEVVPAPKVDKEDVSALGDTAVLQQRQQARGLAGCTHTSTQASNSMSVTPC